MIGPVRGLCGLLAGGLAGSGAQSTGPATKTCLVYAKEAHFFLAGVAYGGDSEHTGTVSATSSAGSRTPLVPLQAVLFRWSRIISERCPSP